MKTFVFPAALAATLFAAAGAFAQTPVPANQRYCLEVRDHSGVHPLLCRFSSEAQCLDSRNSQTDVCMLNPVFAFQQRGY